MMLVGIALTLSTCAGVRGREAAVVDAEAERERQRWSVVTHGVCACVSRWWRRPRQAARRWMIAS